MTFEPSLGYFLPFFAACTHLALPFRLLREGLVGCDISYCRGDKATMEGLFCISQFKFEGVMKNSSIFSKTLYLKPNLILMVKGTSFKFIREIYYVDDQNKVQVLRVNSK